MKPETIPYIVHEDQMARQERHIKRLWILCIIIFVALIGTKIPNKKNSTSTN